MTSASLKDAWRTDRLYFRTLCDTDYDWYFDEIESDPVNHALSDPSILSPPRREKADAWIKRYNALLDVVVCIRTDTTPEEPEEAQDGEQQDTVKDAKVETRIGYLNARYGGCGRSPHNRSCELGITLAAPYQDKGYGTETIQWAVDWAFLRGNMHSVHLSSFEFNPRAHKCYEKCGFKLEGNQQFIGTIRLRTVVNWSDSSLVLRLPAHDLP